MATFFIAAGVCCIGDKVHQEGGQLTQKSSYTQGCAARFQILGEICQEDNGGRNSD